MAKGINLNILGHVAVMLKQIEKIMCIYGMAKVIKVKLLGNIQRNAELFKTLRECASCQVYLFYWGENKKA